MAFRTERAVLLGFLACLASAPLGSKAALPGLRCSDVECVSEIRSRGRLIGRRVETRNAGRLLRLEWLESRADDTPVFRQIWYFGARRLPDSIELFQPERGNRFLRLRVWSPRRTAAGAHYYERVDQYAGSLDLPVQRSTWRETSSGAIARARLRVFAVDGETFEDRVLDRDGHHLRWRITHQMTPPRVQEVVRYDDDGRVASHTRFDGAGDAVEHLGPSGEPTALPPPLVASRNERQAYGLLNAILQSRQAQWVAAGPVAPIVLLGDSIAHGWGAEAQSDLLDAFFGPWDPFVSGIVGDRVQHVLWRLERGALDGVAPRAVVVSVGVNNVAAAQDSSDDVALGLIALLAKLRALCPDASVVITAPFPASRYPQSRIRAELARIRHLIANLSDDERWFVVDASAHFVDAGGLLRQDLYLDPVHLDAPGYWIWGLAMRPLLEVLMAD